MFDNMRGIVAFEAVAPETEVFINRIKESPVPVTGLRCKDGKLFGETYWTDFPLLRSIASENGVQISVCRKRGGIFTAKKYRRRSGILAGIILAAALAAYLSNTVLSIEIYGNENLTDKQIEAALNECGIRIGAFIPGIDLREAERRIVSSIDDIMWIGIRSSGCLIQAEVSEADKPPEMVAASSPCNVVSARDAQIVAIRNVHMGMLIPMLHDGVKKGDLLISGTVENGKGGVYYAHAMGEIIGRYSEKVNFSQPYSREVLRYKEKVTRKTLDFFGLKIPLYVGKNNWTQYEYDESITYLQIFNIKLPVGIVYSEYKLYETVAEEYSPDKARQLLEEKIKLYEANFYGEEDVEIIDREVFFAETGEGMSAAVKYTLEGDIGITREIMAKQPS